VDEFTEHNIKITIVLTKHTISGEDGKIKLSDEELDEVGVNLWESTSYTCQSPCHACSVRPVRENTYLQLFKLSSLICLFLHQLTMSFDCSSKGILRLGSRISQE